MFVTYYFLASWPIMPIAHWEDNKVVKVTRTKDRAIRYWETLVL